MFAGKKSAQIREILISESAWEEMTCLFAPSLAQYTRTPWYGLLISGLLAILVFSRLFGMQALWLAILDGGYVRVVKNVVEEGSESFGYMLCLTASIGYFCTFRETLAQKSY
ncbi:hypothetical protein HV306_13805 [Klebsiella grimontii]|nr:hypothetical protein HV306_13805 [Klebsiella grimontii]